MSVTVSNLIGGANSYPTPPQDVGISAEEIFHEGILTDFQVEAQASPNATVKVNSGVAIVKATPSSESERLFRVRLSADANVTIASNATGSTKYDLVYIKLPAATLHAPAANGDFTEAATLLTERHSASGEALTDTNGLVLAEVTVANGFVSITNSNISNKALYATDGWRKIAFTITYASATNTPEFTATAPGDWSKLVQAGHRFKCTQTTDKFFIVTKVAVASNVTTFTLYGGTDYSLANATIVNPYFSPHKAPLGFNTDPIKWTITTTDSSNQSQNSPALNTWYNLGTITMSICTGSWNVGYYAQVNGAFNSSTEMNVFSTLSTANNSESDTGFTTFLSMKGASGNIEIHALAIRTKALTLAAKTNYFFNLKTTESSSNRISLRGDIVPTVITAISAYL